MDQKARPKVSRRQLLQSASVSASVIGALALTATESATAIKFEGDVAILNVALGLEHQAIAAYEAGAKSKLLSDEQLKIATSFLQDHRRHRDELTKYIRRFGGTPVAPKATYDFGEIHSAVDIVKLAQGLEDGAEGAYLANAGKLENREVLNAAVPILEDEVRHNTVFKQLLGMDVTERLKY